MNLIKLHICIVFNKLFFNLFYKYCIFAIDNDFYLYIFIYDNWNIKSVELNTDNKGL